MNGKYTKSSHDDNWGWDDLHCCLYQGDNKGTDYGYGKRVDHMSLYMSVNLCLPGDELKQSMAVVRHSP